MVAIFQVFILLCTVVLTLLDSYGSNSTLHFICDSSSTKCERRRLSQNPNVSPEIRCHESYMWLMVNFTLMDLSDLKEDQDFQSEEWALTCTSENSMEIKLPMSSKTISISLELCHTGQDAFNMKCYSISLRHDHWRSISNLDIGIKYQTPGRTVYYSPPFSIQEMSSKDGHFIWELKTKINSAKLDRYSRSSSKSCSCTKNQHLCLSIQCNCNPACLPCSALCNRYGKTVTTCVCLEVTTEGVGDTTSVGEKEVTSSTEGVGDTTSVGEKEVTSSTEGVGDTTSVGEKEVTSSTEGVGDTTSVGEKEVTSSNDDPAEATTSCNISESNSTTNVSMALQSVVCSVLVRQDFDASDSARKLFSLSMNDEMPAVNTDNLLNTYDVLLPSLKDVPSEDRDVAASHLMRSLDLFALNTVKDGVYNYKQFVLNVSDALPIDGFELEGNKIVLPPEILVNTSRETTRIVFILYKNLTGSLSANFHGNNDTRLTSSVISSALLCGNTLCDTYSIEIEQPVWIQLVNKDKVSLESKLNCVFWEFLFNVSGAVIGGQWSDRGCALVEVESTPDITVCECNHLTHFAILLSPQLEEITAANKIALQVIGYVGVSISVTTMTITALIFTFIKSLWSLRNYVHIHLCLNLTVAHIIFVVGVDKTANAVACSAVAVLLEYFFLVAFMWMLMEGVVLYIVLVKVFMQEKTKVIYLVTSTILSYGLPILYMCLTVPLGFLLHDKPDYGYDTACWLRYTTNFIWSFITPVLIIILLNIGFLIMEMVVLHKQKSQIFSNKSRLKSLRIWLKSTLSLAVVMGITWIVGIIFFDSNLLPFAYIFTIFVAFQGLGIFIIFIVVSKMVHTVFLECAYKRIHNSSYSESRISKILHSLVMKSRESSNPEITRKHQFIAIAPMPVELGTHSLNEMSSSSTTDSKKEGPSTE